jgi:hypothetical protein
MSAHLTLRFDAGLAGIEHAGGLIETQLLAALHTIRPVGAIGHPLRETGPMEEQFSA